ncbi:MAG: serine hydrolase [Cytophagia bacterium]|nr:serine hydrolase [Cytophagia bacterium]
MFKKVTLFTIFLVIIVGQLSAQKFYHKIDTVAQQQWADSVFNALTPQERLGQLFMVAAYSNRDQKHVDEIKELIQQYNIGGLIFFQGGPYRQARFNNEYQSVAKVPLAIAMDAEWGIGMRLDSVYDFPKQMTLGAIQDRKWIYEMGKEVANQFHILNMHINFAPVVDVNVNPNNPVIGYRSFGENKEEVALRGIEYMKGLQDNGVMANAKHFPGHGDTGVDSHYDLPVIKHSRARMTETELYPFKELMKDSLMSVMVAHLQIPAFDSAKNMPTTLSKNVVTDLLKGELGFEGLAFTDAMNMQGVAKYYDPGEADVKALQAGNDMILFPVDVPKAMKQIEKALKKETLTQEMLDERVKKILKAKYWFGLNNYEPIETANLTKRINNDYAEYLNRILYQKAITVVDNSDLLIPTIRLDDTKFASINLGGNAGIFNGMLDKYANFTHLKIDSLDVQSLDSIAQYDKVIVTVQGITNSPRNQHGVKTEEVEWIKKLQKKTNVIIVVMGNAYSLKYFEGVKNIICTYEDNSITQDITPQIIFGALKAEGKLPISAGTSFKAGMGIETLTTNRLSYGMPVEAGMSLDSLRKIDSIIQEAIDEKATPGAQVLVARKGKVVYQKNYGFQTYEEEKPIDDQTIYDIASVTKVAATTQILMKLYDEKKVDINKPIGYYLEELKGTNKEDLLLRDILSHQAGLKPYIPFWEKTVDKGELNTDYFTDSPGPNHNYRIQERSLPLALADSIWKWTITSDLRPMPKGKKKYDYLYSDLGYELVFHLIEKIIDEPVEEYLNREFYQPLGLSRTMYLPTEKGFYSEIAPTEVDAYFRNTIVCGTVHDQNATLMGGIAGHAGLFSNANDLAILLQMNMQMGQYADKQYFNAWTIPIFTTPQSMENRRGMGWDKPITGTEDGPTSKYASASTFGHTGFTGASIWADPAEELVFIFLCNRTYPDSENFKLIEENVRTRIQDIVYQSILEP